MAVFDAIGTPLSTGPTATSVSGSPITPTANATLLLVVLNVNNDRGTDAAVPTGVSVTYASVPMTLLASAVGGTWGAGPHGCASFLFGLVNPPSPGVGRSLAASWTNPASGYLSSISFGGTFTSSVADACPNPQSNNGTFGTTGANAWNWTLTCIPGDLAIASGCDNRGDFSGQTPGSNTSAWDSTVNATVDDEWGVYASLQATGNTITLNDSVTDNSADAWSGVATNISGPTTPSGFAGFPGFGGIIRATQIITDD